MTEAAGSRCSSKWPSRYSSKDILIKKEAPAQVFPCEYYETFKNIFFTEHLRTTASLMNKEIHINLN